MNIISDFLSNLNIPKNKLIVVHVRIKTFEKIIPGKLDYEQISKEIVDYLMKHFDPISVLIPTYTFSFTKSGVFHRNYSKSETGRFSEEARKMGYTRTLNPIFSFIDTNGYIEQQNNIDHHIAFDKGSIFDHFHQKDAIILNIGLDNFIASQRHYVEYYFNVDYRFDKFFNGIIYHNEIHSEQVNYRYYVRYLDRPTDGNLSKITSQLIKGKVLNEYDQNGVKLFWLTCHNYLEFFRDKMNKDKNYMIT